MNPFAKKKTKDVEFTNEIQYLLFPFNEMWLISNMVVGYAVTVFLIVCN